MGLQDKGESDFVNGTVEKKGYRKRWTNKVKQIPWHPFNHGVHMDTHHLISAEAVKISKLGKLLESKGYDINDLDNLVGFPATLPGACQLKTQLHRGDHKKVPAERSYHKAVASLIEEKKLQLKKCYGKTKKKEKDTEIHNLLDPISDEILDDVNDFDLPLTNIFKNFKSSGIGCANCFDVKPAESSRSKCKNDRQHFENGQRSGIDFRYQDSNVRGNKKVIKYKGSWTPRVGQ